MDQKIFFQWKQELDSNNLSKAIKILETEHKINPKDLQCLYHLGFTWRITGDLDKAEEYYLEILKIDSDYEHANFGVGIIYKLKGELDKAIEYLKKAANVNPYFINAINSLGLTYKLNGNIDTAIEVYIQGIKNLFREVYNTIAVLPKSKIVEHQELISNEWHTFAIETIVNEAAREGLESVLFPTGETAVAFYNEKKESTCWIDVEGKRSITPQYLEVVREKLSSDTMYYVLSNNLGVAYADKGNIEDAVKWFNESIAFIPDGVDYPNPFVGLKNLGV